MIILFQKRRIIKKKTQDIDSRSEIKRKRRKKIRIKRKRKCTRRGGTKKKRNGCNRRRDKERVDPRTTNKEDRLLSWTILTSGSHAMITLRGGRRKEYLLASFIGLYSCVNGGGGFFHGDNAVLPVQEGRNNRFCETRACLGSVLLGAHAIHYTCFMDLDTCSLLLPLSRTGESE